MKKINNVGPMVGIKRQHKTFHSITMPKIKNKAITESLTFRIINEQQIVSAARILANRYISVAGSKQPIQNNKKDIINKPIKLHDEPSTSIIPPKATSWKTSL